MDISSVLAFVDAIGVVPLEDGGAESTAVELPSVVPCSFCLRAAFAAFSARRFCFDADGAIMICLWV